MSEAAAHAAAPDTPTELILSEAGKPFATDLDASAAARRRPDLTSRFLVPVETEGGWALVDANAYALTLMVQPAPDVTPWRMTRAEALDHFQQRDLADLPRKIGATRHNIARMERYGEMEPGHIAQERADLADLLEQLRRREPTPRDTDLIWHERAVRLAIADGLPVPEQVLAEYPELARSREGYRDAVPAGWNAESPAAISPSGRYRYWLRRDLGLLNIGNPPVVFCMLNPSTADAHEDDPTIRRCTAFADSWGAPWFGVVNLFAFRSTEPDVLFDPATTDPFGPSNRAVIYQVAQALAGQQGRIVCGWGGTGQDSAVRRKMIADTVAVTLEMIRAAGLQPHALRVSDRTGQPWHPLYLPATLTPFPWEGAP